MQMFALRSRGDVADCSRYRSGRSQPQNCRYGGDADFDAVQGRRSLRGCRAWGSADRERAKVAWEICIIRCSSPLWETRLLVWIWV